MTKVVYGARCSWWDTIDKIGHTKPEGPHKLSLPCCPHCGSVLFEVPDEASWFKAADEHDRDHPGYRKFLEWARGRCFTDYKEAKKAYELRKRRH